MDIQKRFVLERHIARIFNFIGFFLLTKSFCYIYSPKIDFAKHHLYN